MRRYTNLGLGLALVCALAVLSPMAASAQMVPDTVDPYELAPQNVHLYPISLNARIPFYYLPPIFAPAPMWRGALTAEDVYAMAPLNYIAAEIPESTALVAWGTVKRNQRITLEAANQQEFMVLPPKALDDGSSYMLVRTEMRYVPSCAVEDLNGLFERELLLEPSRVESIAEQLPPNVLMYNYLREEDVADLQPRIHPFLEAGISTKYWPVDRIYINYSGWRRDPNRVRTLGPYVPEWFTFEGKILALKQWKGGNYMITVSLEGYNPWMPIEFGENVMRKVIALSFDQFVETLPYFYFEKPLEGKELHRQGSPAIEPYDTRAHIGAGSPGQGMY